MPGEGRAVSRNVLTKGEAAARSAEISDVHYAVELDLTVGDRKFATSTVARFQACSGDAFIFLDFVVTSRAIAFRRGRATVLVQGQAESRDYERLETVFEAMTASFLRDADMGDEG